MIYHISLHPIQLSFKPCNLLGGAIPLISEFYVVGAIPTYDSLNPIVHSSTHKNSPNRTPKYWLETLVGPQKDNISYPYFTINPYPYGVRALYPYNIIVSI
jgi:hypothetical protein